MSPFIPRGEKARWVLVYELLQTYSVDQVVTYEVMAEKLKLHPDRDRHAIQMATRRAAREFAKTELHALEAVPNLGYRVVLPNEHIRLARGQQKKSSKALARGHSTAQLVDLSALSMEDRRAIEVVAQALALQMDFNRRMDVRQTRLEAAVASIHSKAERSEEEMAQLRERLERLETLKGQLLPALDPNGIHPTDQPLNDQIPLTQ